MLFIMLYEDICVLLFFLKKKEEIDVFREEKNKRVLKRID